MRTAGETIEDHGYKLRGYGFRTMVDNSPQTWYEDDPEPALEEFLQEMQAPDGVRFDREPYFSTDVRSRVVADLITEYTEEDWENTVNEMLDKVRGLVGIGDPSASRPLHQEVDIKYKLNTRGNYFEIVNYDGYEGDEFKHEIIDILQDEGFEAE